MLRSKYMNPGFRLCLNKWICMSSQLSPLVLTSLVQFLLLVYFYRGSALIHHYAPLRPANFAAGAVPAIPPAVPAALRLPIAVQHASFALLEAIRAPPAVGYPTLTGLCASSYICNVLQVWSNATVTGFQSVE